MTSEEVRQLLSSNQITYNNRERKWFYGRAALGSSSNVLLMPMFMGYTMSDIEFIEECMTSIEANLNKGVTSLADIVVGVFLDELQADPKNRMHLDKTIPQYIVPKGFRSFPYEKNCPARKCNEAKLRAYFNHMVAVSGMKTVSALKHPDQVLTFYIERAKRMIEDEIIAKTRYDKSKETVADNALAELYNLYKPAFISFGNEQRFDFGMFKAVIKHFIWHIKNKAVYGQNKEPIMLNISGEQGNGKTQFIRHLFKSILGDLYVETTISVLNDEFGTNLLYESWLLFFDELIRKNGELDVDRLKQVITSTEIKSREIFTSHYTTTFVRSAFIGAANTPIYEIIDDPTGMRRYLNLEFTNSKIVHDKKLHPLLDSLWEQCGEAIWQSVDETQPNGYLVDEYARMMEVAQRTYFSPNNTVYRFLHDVRVEIVTKGTKSVVTGLLDTLYNEHYLAYCKDHDILPQYRVSVEGFKKRIKDLYDAKNETKCKVANLRYVQGSLGRPRPTAEYDDLSDIPEKGAHEVDQRPQMVIPDEFDKYKEFVPVEIPESDVIIRLDGLQTPAEMIVQPSVSTTLELETEASALDEKKTEVAAVEPESYTNDKGQTVYSNAAVAVQKIHPGQSFTFEDVDEQERNGVDLEENARILQDLGYDPESLETKINEIHRIYQRRPWLKMKHLANEEFTENGGFVDSEQYHFRKQALRMHEDILEQFGTDANVDEIEKILKLQSEAMNNFI